MSEYVPTVPEVNGIRDSWACEHVREDITLEQAREAFDRWLASERADAYDEGTHAMAEAWGWAPGTYSGPNPYRNEATP